MKKIVFVSLLLGACAPAESDDALAALEPDVEGKADGVVPVGAFEIVANNLRADDVVYVNLLPPSTKPGVVGDPSWVWQRCYDTPCSQLIAQDGDYAFYKGSAGRKYIAFYTTHIDPPAPPSPKTAPPVPATKNPMPTYSPGDLIDLYAYTKSGKTLKLRRAGTSRWFTTTALSDHAACDESGGAWSSSPAPGACDCSALGTGAFGTAAQFQPGLGGCFLLPNSSETECDDSNGAYTDDDNNLVGTYCECGVGRYYAEGSGCTDVPN
jgi:hypothetical protein